MVPVFAVDISLAVPALMIDLPIYWRMVLLQVPCLITMIMQLSPRHCCLSVPSNPQPGLVYILLLLLPQCLSPHRTFHTPLAPIPHVQTTLPLQQRQLPPTSSRFGRFLPYASNLLHSVELNHPCGLFIWTRRKVPVRSPRSRRLHIVSALKDGLHRPYLKSRLRLRRLGITDQREQIPIIPPRFPQVRCT